MKQRKSTPLNVKEYLKKFDGLEISSDVSKTDAKKKPKEIVIEKWAVDLFDEGFVEYNGEGPP
jgi:hypothetical protein